MEGFSHVLIWFYFYSNQIRQERREHERHSDWLECFEQHKAAAVCRNQSLSIQGQTDHYESKYQDGLPRALKPKRCENWHCADGCGFSTLMLHFDFKLFQPFHHFMEAKSVDVYLFCVDSCIHGSGNSHSCARMFHTKVYIALCRVDNNNNNNNNNIKSRWRS